MFLGHADADAELLRRARLFAGLGDVEQARLVRLVLHNDLRGCVSAGPAHGLSTDRVLPGTATQLRRVVERVESLTPHPRGLIADLAEYVRDGTDRRPHRWPVTWAGALTTLARDAAEPWCVSAGFAACLALAGYVPCPAFAFGRWHLAPGIAADESDVRNLVELASCYAYRLVRLRQPGTPGSVVGHGAYSISTRDGPVLIKTATNLAANDFMLEQEARLLQQASRLRIAGRLPHFEAWDPVTAQLRREYVPGPTGHDLLVRGEFPQQHYVDDLKQAHGSLAHGLRELGVRLDLHPGNFVWHDRRQHWVLVDAGPVPAIGADYYNLDSFEDYVSSVWLRRLDNMRDEPVRSVDWEPLLAGP